MRSVGVLKEPGVYHLERSLGISVMLAWWMCGPGKVLGVA